MQWYLIMFCLIVTLMICCSPIKTGHAARNIADGNHFLWLPHPPVCWAMSDCRTAWSRTNLAAKFFLRMQGHWAELINDPDLNSVFDLSLSGSVSESDCVCCWWFLLMIHCMLVSSTTDTAMVLNICVHYSYCNHSTTNSNIHVELKVVLVWTRPVLLNGSFWLS